MAHAGPHLLTIVGTIVFVVSACMILTFSTATFAAVWVGRGAGAPSGGGTPRHPGIRTLSGSPAVFWRRTARATLRPCRTPTRGRGVTRAPCAGRTSRCWRPVPLRWNDDDAYGHVNNAVHYLLFDTAVNGGSAEVVGNVRALPALGVVAETGCRYLAELRFPDAVTAGLALRRLGRSSVHVRLALFGQASDAPAAVGRFVHVYVDPASRRPVPVPEPVRAAVASTLLDPARLLPGLGWCRDRRRDGLHLRRARAEVRRRGRRRDRLRPARSSASRRVPGRHRPRRRGHRRAAAGGRGAARAGVEAEVFDGVHVEPTDADADGRRGGPRERARGTRSSPSAAGRASTRPRRSNLLTTNAGELMDYVNAPIGGGRAPPRPLKPLVAVPTTTGTGSESTTICVLDVLALKVKTGISHPRLRPTLAVVDPLLTLTPAAAGDGRGRHGHPLPRAGELHGAAVHVLRAQDSRAAGAVLRREPGRRHVVRAGPGAARRRRSARAVRDGDDVAARTDMALAATFAGMGFGNAGVHIPHANAYPIAGRVRDFRPAGYPEDEPMVPHGMAVVADRAGGVPVHLRGGPGAARPGGRAARARARRTPDDDREQLPAVLAA